jgi:hypothetical protein
MRLHHVVLVALCLPSLACDPPPQPTVVPENHQSSKAESVTARDDDRVAGVLERQAAMAPDADACGDPAPSRMLRTCWTSPRPSSTTAQDLEMASKLRDRAREHRRVSAALRDAELRACAGIPDADVLEGPFAHRDDIVDVELLRGPTRTGEHDVVGARVHFHAIEKLSADWLQHLVDCQLARDDALGHDIPELAYDPLVPRDTKAVVWTVPHGYMIEVRSDVPESGREIARRALALMDR